MKIAIIRFAKTMSCMFVGLFCISFIIGINGASIEQAVSINERAIEIAELVQKVWALKPAALNYRKPLVYCQVIDKCCTDEDRTEAISLLSQFMDGTGKARFDQVMDTCMHSTDSSETNPSCSAVVKSMAPSRISYRRSSVEKYFDILSRFNQQLTGFFENVMSSCTSEELHALFCLSNKELVESCTGKILQKIYDDDYENYQTITEDTKRALMDLNQQISKAFNKNAYTQ
jgi:hypothetical protein